ncbi:MAG: hypothetical protein ACYCWW_17265 [Deltaproteobacteria bacterium]
MLRPMMTAMLTVALGFSAEVARAQPAPAEAPVANGGLRVESEEVEHLTDKEKLSRGSDAVQAMQETLAQVLKRVEEARRERDLVKLNCVNEKLTQVKALLRIAEQSYIALQEAVAKSAEGDARHEYAKIGIAKQRVTELRAEAEQCIGQLAYVVDEKTIVTVETPEGLPDVTTNPPVAPPVVFNPPVLSPLQ